MNNRLVSHFKDKPNNNLAIFFTAGFPERNSTLEICLALENAGADIIEIGMPFSDPIAEGPTIQHSSEIALRNGMNLDLLFEQLEELRPRVTVPVLLMGYINPLIQYGIERFCKRCKEVGVDGTILPDLPIEEYIRSYKGTFEAHELANVLLVTPATSEERVRTIDANTHGFVYVMSTTATTGGNLAVTGDTETYIKRIAALNLQNPTMVGFGISDRASFVAASEHTNGGIIGSAFIRATENSSNLERDVETFVHSIVRD